MKLTGLFSLLTALTSSLCCIAPLLALGGVVSSLGWMEAARPYTVALSVSTLLWAWYYQLKPTAKDACGCTPAKVVFWQTRGFLGLMTGVVILLLTVPSYANWFHQDKNQIIQQPAKPAHQIAYVTIKGMTCEGCEHHVKSEVNKLKGVTETKVSYQHGNAVVMYDPKLTSITDIKKAVAATGYQLTGIKTN